MSDIKISFEHLNLNPSIFKALNACGYTKPTPVQARCIPDILNKKDVIASAQTGSGKTAAFVLPALNLLSVKKSGNKPRILILTPTRELATQITNAAQKYGKFLRMNVVSLVGGTSYRQQLKNLSRPVDMIVATPGRLLDHLSNRRLDLSSVEMLVLDEADRMLDMGFIDDVEEIAKAMPISRQTLLFSATVDNQLSHIARKLLKNPIRIDLSNEKTSPPDIKQELYFADSPHHKMRLLKHLLTNNRIYKAIIFSGTKINADRLAKELRDLGFPSAALHGDLKQSLRNRTVDDLRRGKIQYLVATDVAARGIDISDVTHVINFDLPRFSEDYVHRIGRTGRAGKSGIAISFALPSDQTHLQRIERFTNQKMQRETIAGLEPAIKHKAKSSHRNDARPPRHGKPRHHFKEKSFGDKPQKRDRDNYQDNKGYRTEGKRNRYQEGGYRSEGKRNRTDGPRGNAPRGDRFKEKSYHGDKPQKREGYGAPKERRFKERSSRDSSYQADGEKRSFRRGGERHAPKSFGDKPFKKKKNRHKF